jgi:hypothetical protein
MQIRDRASQVFHKEKLDATLFPLQSFNPLIAGLLNRSL